MSPITERMYGNEARESDQAGTGDRRQGLHRHHVARGTEDHAEGRPQGHRALVAHADGRSRRRHGWWHGRRDGVELGPRPGETMSKREDERLAALARKNAAKEAKPKVEKAVKYDDTLRRKPPEAEDEKELREFFNEMKKREF